MIPAFLKRGSRLLSAPREFAPASQSNSPDKAAFIASYGAGTTFSRTIIELTRTLTRRGYDVVIVRASASEQRAEWPDTEEEIRPSIIWRPNVGYDFGSWAVGIDVFPKLASRPFVLFFNDSLVGPFGPIDRMLDHFEASAVDVWGATSTLQFTPHLQSFTLGFREGVLSRYPLKRFWRSIQDLGDKQQIIWEYEIGLSAVIEREMLTSEAFCPAETVVKHELNPVIDGWDALLAADFPFVKRELLRAEHFAPVRTKIIAEVERRYGTNPMEWFETV